MEENMGQARMLHNIAVIAARLANEGIDNVQVLVDGCDDERRVTGIDIEDGDPRALAAAMSKPVDDIIDLFGERVTVLLREAVEYSAYEMLDFERGGWEEGAGSFTTATFSATGDASLEIGFRSVEYDHLSYSGAALPHPDDKTDEPGF